MGCDPVSILSRFCGQMYPETRGRGGNQKEEAPNNGRKKTAGNKIFPFVLGYSSQGRTYPPTDEQTTAYNSKLL